MQFSVGICQRIKKDDRPHIEYVPTQVMSEYFRYIFKYKRKSDNFVCYVYLYKNGKMSFIYQGPNGITVGLKEATYDSIYIINQLKELGFYDLPLLRNSKIDSIIE